MTASLSRRISEDENSCKSPFFFLSKRSAFYITEYIYIYIHVLCVHTQSRSFFKLSFVLTCFIPFTGGQSYFVVSTAAANTVGRSSRRASATKDQKGKKGEENRQS